jgi:hypothetical protein
MDEQEVKIKMAEMCGYEAVYENAFIELTKKDFKGYRIRWNPRKNIGQAMEVLENLGVRWRIVKQKNGFYRVSTYSKKYDGMGFSKNAMREDLKEAIFQAVKSYLEGEL